MSERRVEINAYNEQTSEYEPCSIKTIAEAVELNDGKTLDTKLGEIDTAISGITSAGTPITVSETQPVNPTDGHIWLKIVTTPDEPEEE